MNLIITLEEAKAYLKADHTEEDDLIESLIDAAETYLKNATGRTFDGSNYIARLFCLTLVTDWYENRGLAVGKVREGIRPVIESLLAQLNYCYPEVEK
nr:head-tail connector protein [Tepidanaerobacter sp. EBM-38]